MNSTELERLVNHNPTLPTCQFGVEPCLYDLIVHYYVSHDNPLVQSHQYARAYVLELQKEFEEGTEG
jgi:hypothetical protein